MIKLNKELIKKLHNFLVNINMIQNGKMKEDGPIGLQKLTINTSNSQLIRLLGDLLEMLPLF